MQHMSATHGKTIYHGNDRFGYGAYLLLHVKDREMGHAILADVSATTLYIHVATGTEGIGAHPFLFGLSLLARRVGTGEDNNADAAGFATIAHGIAQFPCGEGSEGVAYMWAVYGNASNALPFVQEYLAVLFYFFPVSHNFISSIVISSELMNSCRFSSPSRYLIL